MEDLKAEIKKLIQEMEKMIEKNGNKKEVEIRRKKLDKLLEQYLRNL